jgi:Xaa-Pro aminopeptidase
MKELAEQWQAAGKYNEFIKYNALAGYRGFGGLRIEEDFLVTAQGSRRLGPAKPRTVAEVEALGQEALAG